jgi:hypothetical protein
VTAGSDFSVKIVKDEDPDLKVKRVYRPAELCGEWELVDSFPDFTIRIVDGMEDFTIELVEKEPGVPER